MTSLLPATMYAQVAAVSSTMIQLNEVNIKRSKISATRGHDMASLVASSGSSPLAGSGVEPGVQFKPEGSKETTQ